MNTGGHPDEAVAKQLERAADVEHLVSTDVS